MTVNEFIKLCLKKNVTAEHRFISYRSSSIVITAKIGELKTADTGARTVIKDNLIEVYEENNVLRVRMGVWA